MFNTEYSSKEDLVMEALDFLSDRVYDCSNNQIAGMIKEVLEEECPDLKISIRFIKNVVDEQWF